MAALHQASRCSTLEVGKNCIFLSGKRCQKSKKQEDPDFFCMNHAVFFINGTWIVAGCKDVTQKYRFDLPISGKKHDCSRVSSSLTVIPFRPLKKGLVMCTSISVCHNLFAADCFRPTGHYWQRYWIPLLGAYMLRITSIPQCTPRISQPSALNDTLGG